jgi:hypothetical protein
MSQEAWMGRAEQRRGKGKPCVLLQHGATARVNAKFDALCSGDILFATPKQPKVLFATPKLPRVLFAIPKQLKSSIYHSVNTIKVLFATPKHLIT